MNNIYLVGFMGTGKTAVGKEIAKVKKCKFIDLDDLIEEKEKRSIPEIFAQNGEPYFRGLEKGTLKEVSQKNNLIVSCGGGIVLDKENINLMKETGSMVCLTASADVILERTRKFNHRPLLNVPDPKGKIESLLKERSSYYALADEVIDTSKISVKEAVGKILNLFPEER
jgi:shikimate kinase